MSFSSAQADSGPSARVNREQEVRLLARLEATPDATVQEHCAWWVEQYGQQLSETTISTSLKVALILATASPSVSIFSLYRAFGAKGSEVEARVPVRESDSGTGVLV